MAALHPLLSIGSSGEAVRLLQSALNLAPTMSPRLIPDAVFGPLTRGRVTEYQRDKKLAADGIVGNETWGSLEPLVQLVIASAQALAGGEKAARERIVEIARKSLALYGWPTGLPKNLKNGGVVHSEMRLYPFRIAAAHCADSNNPLRPRQGGASLSAIFTAAGGTAVGKVGLCGTIKSDIEVLYQKNLKGEEAEAKRTKLNNEDLGSWCGIFATAVCRLAGLKIDGWPLKVWPSYKKERQGHETKEVIAYPQEQCDFEHFDIEGDVKPGDLGIYDYAGTNHHFVVVDVKGKIIETVDGNIADPDATVVAPWSSVIGRRSYQRMGPTSLRAEARKDPNHTCYFMRPMWANLARR